MPTRFVSSIVLFALMVFSHPSLAESKVQEVEADATLGVALMDIGKASGYVPPNLSYRIQCRIHSNYVVLRYTKAGGPVYTIYRRTRYTRQVPRASWAQYFINQARFGKISVKPGPTDLPTAAFYGFWRSGGTIGSVLLYDDRDYSIRRNLSYATKRLLAFGNLNCPIP